ncbi:SUMF1/EgtB/PvdO family nonheme iron enzyme [Fluviicola taffensis]|uniref:SUMF1/EgtB/PvdO family nonheme iron enzyme n=1 Tax=Fluviicola taffensis TaxID=191579 RepID=UPI003137AA94
MDKQQNLEQLFLLAKQDQVVQSFEQTKERFIASASAPSVNKTKTKQVFTKKWMIMLATVSTISLSLFLLLNKGETSQSDLKSNETNTKQAISEYKNTQPKKIKSETTKQGSIPSAKVGAPFLESIQELVTELPFISENKVIEDRLGAQANWNPKPPKGMDDLPYQFPKLTEEEIVLTKKKKKAMLKALVKHDKDFYTFIPSGSFDYNGTQTSVQAYYIGTCEVTNFEYRTFLFDLLIQGRNDEFLKAKPDQSQWSKMENLPLNTFEEHYFSHKAYNEYPVVNVSREGAELYCLWLSQEVRKYVGDEKEAQYNDVRLPLRAEWVKAASNEGKFLPYPWGGPFTRNSKGYILANYLRLDEEALQTTQGTKATDVTAPSKSYWPNESGLYNMSGNVAEMVYEGMNKSEPGTSGGSWRNTEEEIKIYAPDPNKGVIDAKPTIGFRVVSTYLIVYKK